jgi:hypothetical protein
LTRIHIRPAIGKAKPSKLSALQVQSFHRRKLDEGPSAATVVKIHPALSKSLKQAVLWRLVPFDDPCGEIARRALSSMFEVPDASAPGTEVSEAEAAAGEYYRAAGVGDGMIPP